MCHRCILRLRCVLQVLTSPVPPGIAKACTLGQDRAHAAQREAVCGVSTKKLAQHGPSTGVSAKALAQRTDVCGSSAKKLAQRTKKGPKTALYGVLGELFRACTHTRPSRANFFAPMLRATPLLTKIAPKTGVSTSQWCRRFHRRQSARQQR